MAKKGKGTRRSKQEVFIDENFEVTQKGDVFTFTPKEGSEFTEIATIEDVEDKKTACLLLYDVLKPGAPEEPKDTRVSLMDLAVKHGTDKLAHGYIPFYEKHIGTPKRLLEIGCYEGASTRMWREYFPPSVEVASLDLFIEKEQPDIDGVQFFKGNQSDVQLLEFLAANDFDVVIDDGSHGAKDQWLVLNTFVKPGTLVIIEDLHCNFDGNGFWNQGLAESETILGKIKSGSFPYKHECYLDKIVFVWG